MNATTGADGSTSRRGGRAGSRRGSRRCPQYEGAGANSATPPTTSEYVVFTAWVTRAIANAGPAGTPRATSAAVAAASYEPKPPGVTATICAAIVTAVTAIASCGPMGAPTWWAIWYTTAD